MEFCKFDKSRHCWHLSCRIFDSVSGNVVLCPLYVGSGAMLTPHKRVPEHNFSIFNKHHRSMRKGGDLVYG